MKFAASRLARLCRCVLTAVLVAAPTLSSAGTFADESTGPQPVVRDVRLQSQGLLQLTVVDGRGVAVASQPVQIRYADKTVAQATTNESGIVSFSGLRPGPHLVVAPHGAAAFRFWNPDQAPPAALSSPAIVSDTNVVRGQMGPGGGLLPLLTTGLSIAAIVVAVDAKNEADDAHSLAAQVAADNPPASP